MDSIEPTMTPDSFVTDLNIHGSNNKRTEIIKSTDIQSFQDQLDDLKRLVLGFQGKMEQILVNITDIKKDILIIKRGIPNIKTEGPVNHFREDNDRR